MDKSRGSLAVESSDYYICGEYRPLYSKLVVKMKSLRDEEKELERQKKIAFQSGQNRQVFPGDLPKDRLGAGLSTYGDPNLGPAKYNVDDKTCMNYRSEHLPVSKRGYSLAARTAPRIQAPFIENVPGPGAYEADSSIKIHRTSQKNVPFLYTSARLVKVETTADETVGPGQYEHEIPRYRRVSWDGTFGSRPRNLPGVDHESFIPSNTDKLLSAVENRRYNRRLAYLKLYYESSEANKKSQATNKPPQKKQSKELVVKQ